MRDVDLAAEALRDLEGRDVDVEAALVGVEPGANDDGSPVEESLLEVGSARRSGPQAELRGDRSRSQMQASRPMVVRGSAGDDNRTGLDASARRLINRGNPALGADSRCNQPAVRTVAR